MGVSQERRARTTIFVTAAPSRSRGCAEIGGDHLLIAAAAPWRFTTKRLARLFEHEVAHLIGSREHEIMHEKLLYSLGPTSRWADGLKVRYERRAPPQLGLLQRELS